MKKKKKLFQQLPQMVSVPLRSPTPQPTLMYSSSIYLIITLRFVQLEPAYTNYSGITMSYCPPQPAGEYYQGWAQRVMTPSLDCQSPQRTPRKHHSISLRNPKAETQAPTRNHTLNSRLLG